MSLKYTEAFFSHYIMSYTGHLHDVRFKEKVHKKFQRKSTEAERILTIKPELRLVGVGLRQVEISVQATARYWCFRSVNSILPTK